jgi:polysaccharide export outer membrane protein
MIMQNNLKKFCAMVCAAALVGAPSLSAQAPVAPPSAGELRVGDRILLSVEGEPTLTDTFTVRPGPLIDLPGLGAIRLDGVRRDSLQRDMTREIGRFILNPVVHARALVRVAVLGEVTKPGFYSVPADAPFTDVLNAAGGPTRDAAMAKLYVDRAGVVGRSGKAMQRALATGATLEQIDVQSGDQVMVPRTSDTESKVRIASLLVGIPLGVVAIFLFRR